MQRRRGNLKLAGDRRGRLAPHAGFTLLELLMVLAVITVLMSLAWPRMMGVLQRQSVQTNVEAVRRTLDHARVRAVEEGRVLQVRFEPNGRRYVILPSDPVDPNEAETTSPVSNLMSDSQQGAAFRQPFRVAELTEDCRFYVANALTGEPLRSERLDDPWLQHLENSHLGRDAQWLAPILYYPDGSASDGRIIVIDQERRSSQLIVRGLTGSVSTTSVTYLPEIYGASDRK